MAWLGTKALTQYQAQRRGQDTLGLAGPNWPVCTPTVLQPSYSYSPAPASLAPGCTVASWHPAGTHCQLWGRELGESVFALEHVHSEKDMKARPPVLMSREEDIYQRGDFDSGKMPIGINCFINPRRLPPLKERCWPVRTYFHWPLTSTKRQASFLTKTRGRWAWAETLFFPGTGLGFWVSVRIHQEQQSSTAASCSTVSKPAGRHQC